MLGSHSRVVDDSGVVLGLGFIYFTLIDYRRAVAEVGLLFDEQLEARTHLAPAREYSQLVDYGTITIGCPANPARF